MRAGTEASTGTAMARSGQPALARLLDLHGELCSDARRPSPDWFRKWQRYEALRKTIDPPGQQVDPFLVPKAVIERFGRWASPEERAALLGFDRLPLEEQDKFLLARGCAPEPE